MKKLLVYAAVLFMTGCADKNGGGNGTSTGNPLVSLKMTSSSNPIQVVKSIYHMIFDLLIPKSFANPAPSALTDAKNNAVIISQFWVSLGDIEFKSSESKGDGEIDGTEVEFAGPYIIDMLSAMAPPLAVGNLSNSDFRRIKYQLKAVTALPSTAPN